MGPDVVALAHALGRVVALPEKLQQRLVARDLRVIDDEHRFGVAGASAAHLFVGRVGGGASGVADGGDPDPRRLPEHPLGTPKAAEPEDRFFQALGVGPDESMAVDKMPLRHGHHHCPAGQTLCGPGNDQLVTGKWPHRAPLFSNTSASPQASRM